MYLKQYVKYASSLWGVPKHSWIIPIIPRCQIVANRTESAMNKKTRGALSARVNQKMHTIAVLPFFENPYEILTILYFLFHKTKIQKDLMPGSSLFFGTIGCKRMFRELDRGQCGHWLPRFPTEDILQIQVLLIMLAVPFWFSDKA